MIALLSFIPLKCDKGGEVGTNAAQSGSGWEEGKATHETT